MLLPWLMLGIAYSTQYARFSRGAMIDSLNEDYVRTARAKGLAERTVTLRHALRAAIVPVVTIFGLDFACLLVGTIFTEKIFGIQGIGLAGLDAVQRADLPMVSAVTLIGCGIHRHCEYRGRHPVQRDRPEGAPVMTQTNEPASQRDAGHPTEPTGTEVPFLVVEDLTVRFPTADGLVQAVSGLSYTIDQGKTLGIVGESGSGKSVSSLAVMGLHDAKLTQMSGSIRVAGKEILGLSNDAMRRIRGREIAMIFQDPLTALHPFYKVGAQISEAYRAHHDVSKAKARDQGDRDARPGRHPAGAHPRRRLPAPVLRRHATARDDRDGAGQRPVAAHRRRAHHGAGRHGAGADPGPAPGAPAGVQLRDHHHHPRPRRGRRDGRRGAGDVRRPCGRVRHDAGRSSRTRRCPTRGVCSRASPT